MDKPVRVAILFLMGFLCLLGYHHYIKWSEGRKIRDTMIRFADGMQADPADIELVRSLIGEAHDRYYSAYYTIGVAERAGRRRLSLSSSFDESGYLVRVFDSVSNELLQRAKFKTAEELAGIQDLLALILERDGKESRFLRGARQKLIDTLRQKGREAESALATMLPTPLPTQTPLPTPTVTPTPKPEYVVHTFVMPTDERYVKRGDSVDLYESFSTQGSSEQICERTATSLSTLENNWDPFDDTRQIELTISLSELPPTDTSLLRKRFATARSGTKYCVTKAGAYVDERPTAYKVERVDPRICECSKRTMGRFSDTLGTNNLPVEVATGSSSKTNREARDKEVQAEVGILNNELERITSGFTVDLYERVESYSRTSGPQCLRIAESLTVKELRRGSGPLYRATLRISFPGRVPPVPGSTGRSSPLCIRLSHSPPTTVTHGIPDKLESVHSSFCDCKGWN